MNVVVVNQGSEQRVVECQPDRSASVHRCIGTLGWQACMLFAPLHKASADSKTVVWCGHINWIEKPVEPLCS